MTVDDHGPRPTGGNLPGDDRRESDAASLAEALAARDAFIAAAAHELRNPMTPIIAQVQLMRRQIAARTASIERLDAGLERLEWMTAQYLKRATTLLDVSRVTTGKLQLEPRPFHLATVVRQVVVGYAPVAALARCPIDVDADDAIRLIADPLAVEQIVDNLVSNALKYGAGKPIDVTARIEGRHVVLGVVDRGIGISEADRRRIFGRFERALGSGAQTGGLGVGLWIVVQLVEAMGGIVEVESSPGAGSTFMVRLPQQPEGQG